MSMLPHKNLPTIVVFFCVLVVFSGVAKSSFAESELPLTSLDVESISSGWKRAKVNRLIRKQPLSLGGKAYQDGIEVSANSYMRIKVNDATRFTALIGIDEGVVPKGKGSVVFRVWADDQKLFESGLMRSGDKPQKVDVDLAGKEILCLEVDGTSDGIKFDNAGWADAKFVVQGKRPEVFHSHSEERVILTPKPGPAPKINGPRLFGVRPGKPFLYRIPCTGTRPIRFAVESLPEGLTLDATTGVITGQAPKTKGEYAMTFRAKNRHGQAEKKFTLVVGDTLALTPPMGWNAWYIFYTTVTEDDVRRATDAMINSGMADYGYMYVSIDDCWMKLKGDTPYRDEKGAILPNAKFPEIKELVDYIHSHGLRAGIYTSPGPWTCNWGCGSIDHERIDAEKFAEWGFDLLKYDLCSYKGDKTVAGLQKPYRQMGDILQTLDRDMVFNICEYGKGDVWKWGAEVGGHSWRTTGDLGLKSDGKLPGCFEIGLMNMEHWKYAGPGAWNDPDYFLLGRIRRRWTEDQKPEECKLTGNEQYSYMSMWSLMASPLFFSGDMTDLDEFTLNLLCNSEVIDVNQDALGKQAEPVLYKENDMLVLSKPLEDGSLAVGIFNFREQPHTLKIDWKTLGIEGKQRVRDVWRQKELGVYADSFEVTIGRHGVALVRIRK